MSTSPQFVATPNPGTPGSITAANTDLTGATSSGRLLAFTAGASGSVLPSLRVMHLGSNSSATVIRVFKNNGGDPNVAANNTLIAEATVAANTVSQTAASVPVDITLNVKLKGGATPERIYVTSGTAGSSAGYQVTPINGGDF